MFLWHYECVFLFSFCAGRVETTVHVQAKCFLLYGYQYNCFYWLLRGKGNRGGIGEKGRRLLKEGKGTKRRGKETQMEACEEKGTCNCCRANNSLQRCIQLQRWT